MWSSTVFSPMGPAWLTPLTVVRFALTIPLFPCPLLPWTYIQPVCKEGQSGTELPWSSPGLWWMNRSRRVNTPASSPSDGTTPRCTSYIPLEILRGMKPQLPTEGACSCTCFSVSLPLSHFLTSWLLLLPNKWLALEFYSQINFWGSPI